MISTTEIQKIVIATINEYERRKALDYRSVLKIIEPKIRLFYANKCSALSYAMRAIAEDPYIDVIRYHYKDGRTLEWIAEKMDKDVTTIKRNKKRLILSLYQLLEVS